MSGLSLAAVSLSISGAALAQVADGSGGVALEAEARAAGGDEIIVTARRRSERLQDVPVSLKVLDQKILQDYGTSTLIEVQNRVPNLVIQQSPGNQQISIRGFGSTPGNYAFDQSVSIYMDGIYGGRSRQFMVGLFDIEHVEVLRGPQGALLGKNTAAGAISITSGRPTRELKAEITGTANVSRGGGDVMAYVSGPLSPTLAARVAVKYVNMGGYIDNLAIDEDVPINRSHHARASLAWDPDSNFSMYAKYQYDRTLLIGNTGVALPIAGPNNSLSLEKNGGIPFGQRDQDRQTSHNASLQATLTLGEHTLTGLGGYSYYRDRKHFGISNTNPEVFAFTSREVFDQFSGEIRLASPEEGFLQYIVGGYYDDATYDTNLLQTYRLAGGARAGANRLTFGQKAKTWSAFGEASLNPTPQFQVQGSLRYTHNSKSADFRNTPETGFPLFPPNALSDAIKSDNVDPAITFRYKVPDFMVYATYARGSKGGGFDSNTPTASRAAFSYGPEKSESYELGVKATWLDGALTTNVALFHTQFKDLQVSVFVPAALGFLTENAASATSKGVEADVTLRLADGFSITGSVAYLDAAYDDFPGAACRFSSPPGCTPATNNLRGERLPSASKWSGNVSADYSTPLTDDVRLSLSGALSFRSTFDVYPADPNPAFGQQKGFAKVDARIQLSSMDDRWRLGVFARNIGNKVTKSYATILPGFIVPAAFGATTFLDEGRSVGIQATWRY